MRKGFFAVMVALAFIIAQGCVGPSANESYLSANESYLNDVGFTDSGITAIRNSNDLFAFDIFNVMSNNQNLFISPYSMYGAFAMLYEGAREDSESQIREAFKYPGKNELRPNFAHVYNMLNNKSEGYNISIANSVWVQKNFPVNREYILTVNKYYGAEVNEVDFMRDPINATKRINGWTESKTNGKIKDLLDHVDDNTIAVLVNAIYFKGKWEHAFDKSRTKDDMFTASDGEKQQTKMMQLGSSAEGVNLMYANFSDAEIIKLPYKGNKMAMYIILPKKKMNNLTFEQFDEYKSRMKNSELWIEMPKFKVETERYDMIEYMKSLGIVDVFDANAANLSGISNVPQKPYVSKVVHKAFIEVDEEGTEAAGATAIDIVIESMPMKKIVHFRADHPFIYIIEHEDAGVLFMGRLDRV